jgi:hypothetical protein
MIVKTRADGGAVSSVSSPEAPRRQRKGDLGAIARAKARAYVRLSQSPCVAYVRSSQANASGIVRKTATSFLLSGFISR